jgi:hypothetical protein
MTTNQATRSRVSGIALRCLQAVVWLVAGLLISELGLRVVNHETSSQLALYQPESVLGYSMKPNQAQHWNPYHNQLVTVRTNSQGFRGPEWPGSQKKNGSASSTPGKRPPLDIMVGDSHVFGYGINEADTLPAQLGSLLKKPVLNMGVNGYGPSEYNDILQTHVPKLHPDTIWYVIDLASDPYDLLHSPTKRYQALHGYLQSSQVRESRYQRIIFHPWLKHSTIAKFIQQSFPPPPIHERIDPFAVTKEVLRNRDIDATLELAQRKKSELYLLEIRALQFSVRVEHNLYYSDKLWNLFMAHFHDLAIDISRFQTNRIPGRQCRDDLFSSYCKRGEESFPHLGNNIFASRKESPESDTPSSEPKSYHDVERKFISIVKDRMHGYSSNSPTYLEFSNYLESISEKNDAWHNFWLKEKAFKSVKPQPVSRPLFEIVLQNAHYLARRNHAQLFVILLDTQQNESPNASMTKDILREEIWQITNNYGVPMLAILPEELKKGSDYTLDNIYLNRTGNTKVSQLTVEAWKKQKAAMSNRESTTDSPLFLSGNQRG